MSLESSIKSDFWDATSSWTGKYLHSGARLRGMIHHIILEFLDSEKSQLALIALNLEGVFGICSLIGVD